MVCCALSPPHSICMHRESVSVRVRRMYACARGRQRAALLSCVPRRVHVHNVVISFVYTATHCVVLYCIDSSLVYFLELSNHLFPACGANRRGVFLVLALSAALPPTVDFAVHTDTKYFCIINYLQMYRRISPQEVRTHLYCKIA